MYVFFVGIVDMSMYLAVPVFDHCDLAASSSLGTVCDVAVFKWLLSDVDKVQQSSLEGCAAAAAGSCRLPQGQPWRPEDRCAG